MSGNIGIISLGHFLPKRILTNFDLEKLVDTSDEWIQTRTGIKERRIAEIKETNSYMAIKAAKQAIKNADIDPMKIDLIIVATISPDSAFPSVACLVQKGIGAKKATAFDVGAACSGFLFAMTTAKQYLASGMYKKALVIASEKITNYLDWNDRNTCVLFGDGAGACILAPVRGSKGMLSEYLHSNGELANLMEVISTDREPLDQHTKVLALPYINMLGKELFKHAVNSMAEGVEIALHRAGYKLSDVNCVVPHQANDRIITGVAKKLKIEKEKIFINIHKYGNMSAASIAVALYEAEKSGRIKKGDIVVLVAFGAGLVTATNIIKW